MSFLSIQIHTVATMFQLDCVRFCQALTYDHPSQATYSNSVFQPGPQHLPVVLAMVTVDWWKDSRSVVELSNKSLFDRSSIVPCAHFVDFPLGKSEQAGTIQAWHRLGVGKICLGSGEEGLTPKRTLGEYSSLAMVRLSWLKKAKKTRSRL